MMMETRGTYSPRQIKGSYLPCLPPNAPKVATAYTRATLSAPITALMGVIVDGKQPPKFPVSPRCRERKLVGNTNRWRIPYSLGSDLLGSSQAVRSVHIPYNQTMVHIMTGEGPHGSINLDMSKEYKFRQSKDRPITLTQPHQYARRSTTLQTSKELPRTAPAQMSRSQARHIQAGALNTYVPTSARPAKPLDLFLYHSKKTQTSVGPDVLLRCLDMDWELHRPYLQKSETLSTLLHNAENPTAQKYYRNPISEKLDHYISKSNFYSNEYQEMSNRLSTVDLVDDDMGNKGVTHPSNYAKSRIRDVTEICMTVHDSHITKEAMAVALGNLYHDETEVEVYEVARVLSCAHALKFKYLEDGCAQIMLRNITSATVCSFYAASARCNRDDVATACERWLELNLVPQLSTQIQLRDLPMDLMQKVLKSNRLFTYNEFALYKVLVYWLFLQLNPHIQLMPSHSTVSSFFNSLPKASAFLEREDGQVYAPLFMALRLHGITDTNHIQDMQQMNILPAAWIIQVLSEHYHALQGGGDMSLMNNYTASTVRQGFLVDNEPPYHSEIFSLHGFHFELKAVRRDISGLYSFFMQRLKPSDPMLSFRQCERQTFSMRPDREVKYNIRVQTMNHGNSELYSTGQLIGRFGLGEKTSRSEVLTLTQLKNPIYVTFSVMFPKS